MRAYRMTEAERQRRAERMKALHADPIFRIKRIKSLNAGSEIAALTGDERALYDRLRRKGCSCSEALAEARRHAGAAE